MRLGSVVPDFSASTTAGPLSFYDWMGDEWCLLFSHPADFTPVCTTELARMVDRVHEFQKRRVRLLGHSCDPLQNHKEWIKDVLSITKNKPKIFPYPIIADESRDIAIALGMLDESERTVPGIIKSIRAVYVISPSHRVRLSMFYPVTTGRNIDEILRVIDSLQLADRLKIVTPVDWKIGGDVLLDPSVSQEDQDSCFPNGVETIQMPSGLAYVRTTPSCGIHECWDRGLI